MINLAKPTAAQLAWHECERAMFFHLDPCWPRYEHKLSPQEFNPEGFNAVEWLDLVESFGAKQVVMVCKHQSGFCHWQTTTTDFGIASSPWKNGKGDIVREVADETHRRGLRFGVYLQGWDMHFGSAQSGLCSTPEKQADYEQYYRTQLTELLSCYGPVTEVWFDGSLAFSVEDILQKYAPDAVIFQGGNASIRWLGNEQGFAPYPAWNSVSSADARSGVSTAVHSEPDGDAWMPIEVDTTIRDHFWFWTPNGHEKLKSLEHLMDIYYQSVGHGAVLLLNCNPRLDGSLDERDVERTREFGAEIARRFATPLAETQGQGSEIELTLDTPQPVDHLILAEDIAEGERVREYTIKALVDDAWQTVETGSAVGFRKIDFFEPVMTKNIRVCVNKSVGEPLWKSIAAYAVGVRPTFERNQHKIANPMDVGSIAIKPGCTSEQNIDLSKHCHLPGQYEIQLVMNDSSFEVEQVDFIAGGGVAANDYLKATEVPGCWHLNITAHESDKALHLVLRNNGNTPLEGHVIVRRIF